MIFSDNDSGNSDGSSRELIEVPIVGTVTAGIPILATENIEDTFPIPSDYAPNGNIFMLRVKGDSMINIGIYNEDQIVVKKCSSAENGDIVVALIDDSATVKRFYRENGHVRLQPENDFMDPIIIDDCDIG